MATGHSHPSPSESPSTTIADHSQQAVEQLGDAIAELSARLTAATYELLVLIQEFDRQEGWTGFASCAHWLSWRIGLGPVAAREKVRVAHALAALPLVSAAMQRGEVSYSKVRAISRVATPDTESALLDVARSGTASHVERIVRAWRRVDRRVAAQGTDERHLQRALQTWVDENGMVVVRGRLAPEVGAVLLRALEAASDRLRRDNAAAASTGEIADDLTVEQCRADALGLIVECALSANLDAGQTGDRYQVVVHVDDDALRHAAAAGHATLEDPATHASAESSRRIACDASIVQMRHDRDGTPLDVGRKRRTVPPAIRRALAARDRRCRFPGCQARRCDAHHVRHWADGGATSLDNLLMLCRRHHRAVHEGGVRLGQDRDGTICFALPDGRPLPPAPEAPRWHGRPLAPTTRHLQDAGLRIHPHTATPIWDGERLDLTWAIDVLHPAARTPGRRDSTESSATHGPTA